MDKQQKRVIDLVIKNLEKQNNKLAKTFINNYGDNKKHLQLVSAF